MCEIIYLHGFGTKDPSRCHVGNALGQAAGSIPVLKPSYHPGGDVVRTNLARSLSEFQALIERSSSTRTHLVGYSFGGLLAAVLAERHFERVGHVLLLAPAIDNFDRNYANIQPSSWSMPSGYVRELRSLTARPRIVRPTTVVHGMLDNDDGGSQPWRILEWSQQESFSNTYLVDRTDHSLEPWLSAESWINDDRARVPTLREIVQQFA